MLWSVHLNAFRPKDTMSCNIPYKKSFLKLYGLLILAIPCVRVLICSNCDRFCFLLLYDIPLLLQWKHVKRNKSHLLPIPHTIYQKTIIEGTFLYLMVSMSPIHVWQATISWILFTDLSDVTLHRKTSREMWHS